MPVLTAEDVILASAARFLIDGGEFQAAKVLLLCELDIYKDQWGNESVEMRAPRSSYDVLHGTGPLDDWNLPLRSAVDRAFNALGFAGSRVRAQFITIDAAWRTEFMDAAKAAGVHNQAADAKNFIVWNNLRFRSVCELRVAQALDARKILFWPNCKARLGLATRENREADFLVCHKGKFGILEVDGEQFHPPSRTAQDHERDRLFKAHGILIAEHFDAGECAENADGVVEEFLKLLEQAR